MKVLHKYWILGYLALFFSNAFSQKTPDHHLLKGVAFYEMQRYDSAIHYFNMATNAMKDYPEAHISFGLCLMEKGQNAIAIEEFLKAEKDKKGIASLWISKVYARMGESDKMLEYLELNLRSKYRVPESSIFLDTDFQRFEQHEDWKKFWRNTQWYSTLDMILFESGYLLGKSNFIEALDIVNDGLKRGFNKSDLLRKRAEIYLAMNNNKMALSDLTTAIEGDRRNPELLAMRASVNMELDRIKQALEDYNQAVRFDPLNLYLYPERALALNINGMYEPAIDDMNYYLTYFPEDHQVWYSKGIIHMSNQKYFRALETFNRAIEINPTKAEYYSARGETYLHTKTYRYAWNDLSMSLDLNPVNSKAYLNKGIAAIHLGNIKDACFSFEMARRQGAYEAEDYIRKYCNK